MMATIPIDVLYSCILPRLPVKTLTRFKSVSKSWQTIISSREFIHLHHHNTLSSDANRLIVFANCALHEFHIHELESPLSPSVHLYNSKPAPTYMSILASSEFFLLINFRNIIDLFLLNPSTGRYYKIPYPPYDSGIEHYGIYLDEANNDYKVVRLTQKSCFRSLEENEMNMEVMVYSLRTNKWRLIERTVEKCYSWCSVVIGHLFHIDFALKYTNCKRRIGCFDILAEKWTTDVPMPEINVNKSIELRVLDGLLCVTTLDSTWVMKEYGVKDSWFKLMSMAYDDIWGWPNITPIAFRKGSQDEVLCYQYRNSKLEYIWYNVREKKATTATLNGVLPYAKIEGIRGNYICKGSLVDFPGGRNMKLLQPKQAEETIMSSENYPFLSIDLL